VPPSEYDPIRTTEPGWDDDLEETKDLFERAAGPFLRSPVPWLSWALILPASAISTQGWLESRGPMGVLLLWSVAVMLGGTIEIGIARRGRGGSGSSSLARWVLRAQGNLSVIGLALSTVVVMQGVAWLLPAIWLLLLGHSLWSLGGLAFAPLKATGLLYQLGGVLALWPGGSPLLVLALATAVGNLWAAFSIWRSQRSDLGR